MNNLINLELKKTDIIPYLWAVLTITLSMIGFLYTFSLIAYTGNDLDAAEFSSYHSIFAMTSALNMTAHSILAAVMFSRLFALFFFEHVVNVMNKSLTIRLWKDKLSVFWKKDYKKVTGFDIMKIYALKSSP